MENLKRTNGNIVFELVESEGIENYEEVKRAGVDYSQGYYFSKSLDNL